MANSEALSAAVEQELRKQKRSKNDIRDIRSFKMLEKVELDLESPRFIKACQSLGIAIEECKKKYDEIVTY